MKQIFDHRIYLSFDNGKTWEDTNILKNWEYRYPECAKEDSCTIRTYDDARTFVLNSCIPNATIRRTMFGNECIDLTTVPRMYGVRLTRRRFRPFQIKTVFEPVPNPVTLRFSTLVSLLSLGDLIDYMRSLGVTLTITQNNTQEDESYGT